MDSDSAQELHDDALAGEIKLLVDLVLAASSMPRHLTPAEVDQVLELETSPGSRARPSASRSATSESSRPRST